MKIQTITKLAVALGLCGLGTAFANSFSVQMDPSRSIGYVGAVQASTDQNGNFLTFCLEEHVNIYIGTGYSYTIDSVVLNGNTPLALGTQYLFNQFSNNNSFVATQQDGVDLQKAIWAFQQNIVLPSNIYYSMALGYTGPALSNIQVVNPYVGSDHQDVQSFLINVPDGSSTLGLIGLGMMALALFRRRN